jgi:hypothetical protein
MATVCSGPWTGWGCNSAATSRTNVITITGWTGRFANATRSYTETYPGQMAFADRDDSVGSITATIKGLINLGAPGYLDPLARRARHQREWHG